MTYERCWVVVDAMARLLRAQPGGDEPGAEHVIDTEGAPLEELEAGQLEAQDRNQHGFLLVQPGNMQDSYPWRNIRG